MENPNNHWDKFYQNFSLKSQTSRQTTLNNTKLRNLMCRLMYKTKRRDLGQLIERLLNNCYIQRKIMGKMIFTTVDLQV